MIYAKYWRYAVPTLTGIVTDNLSWIKVAGEKSEKDNAITFHESIEPCNTTMRLFEPHVLSAKAFPFSPPAISRRHHILVDAPGDSGSQDEIMGNGRYLKGKKML